MTSNQTPRHLEGIDHFTLRCAPSQLDSVHDFYGKVLDLHPGPRPPIPFPGHWLYLGDRAILHIVAILPEGPAATGPHFSGFDHVALKANGIDKVRKHLRDLNVEFEESPVPERPLMQIFLQDPIGSKIELTFEIPA